MFRALIHLLLLFAPIVAGAQQLKISGTVKNARTGGPVISASVSVKEEGASNKLVQTDSKGIFQITLSGRKAGISIKSAGYLPQNLTINPVENLREMDAFLPVLLVPVEKQATDKPYLQAEQGEYTLGNNTTEGNATRIFETRDAVTGKPVAARICLYFTNKSRKECEEIPAGKPGLKMTFTHTDIIALEIQVPGYQDYKGNLILDKLDRKTSVYQIWLSPMVHMVSFTSRQHLPECYQEGTKTNLLQSQDGMHYWTFVKPGATYKLRTTRRSSRIPVEKTFIASEGISFQLLDDMEAELPRQLLPSPTLQPAVALADTSKKTVLYFDKSQYRLRPENHPVLDSLVHLLKSDPTISARISGFTDNVGPSNLNETLAEYRARVTFHYLISKGADPKRLKSYSQPHKTKTSPKLSESDKEKDRRVEIQFTRKANELSSTKNG